MLKSIAPLARSDIFETNHPDETFSFQCLSEIDQLAAIEDDWRRLERQNPEQFICFQSFDWCYQWCVENKMHGAERLSVQIQVYVLRKNDVPVLILPLMVRKTYLGVKSLSFLTEPHAQYGNLVYNKNEAPLHICQELWAHIKENCAVDAIALSKLPAGSFLTRMIGGDGFVEKSNKHCSMLDLNAFEDWDEYLASLDAKSRKKRNRVRNKLAKHGEVSFETYSGGSDEYRELVALALDFKLQWLAETGRRDNLLAQNFTRTYLCNLPGTPATKISPPEGALLFVLKLNDKPIAMEFGTCLNGQYYSYLGAFDWQHRNLSPGKVQIEMAQEWSKAAGLHTFDFLGDPMDYKSEWTNKHHGLESRTIAVTARGFLYAFIWKARFRPALHSFFNDLNANTRARILGWVSALRNGLKAG